MSGTFPVKSARDIETIGVNVPVMLGGVQIIPGDLILMDRTGAVAIPVDRIDEVLKEAEKNQCERSKNGRTDPSGNVDR